MQAMPLLYSKFGPFMIHVFRYLFLYSLILMICKYFIRHFYVVFVFCNIFKLELIS